MWCDCASILWALILLSHKNLKESFLIKKPVKDKEVFLFHFWFCSAGYGTWGIGLPKQLWYNWVKVQHSKLKISIVSLCHHCCCLSSEKLFYNVSQTKL